jgi:hypothetical protein
MKILKYIIFLSILSGIFFVVYHQSDKKGFGRVWMSLKMAAIIAAILAGLIPASTEAIEPSVNNNQVVHERVIGDREFNSLEDNDRHVILAKTGDSAPSGPTSTGRGQPSNFPTPPSGGRPSRSVSGVNPYRTAPKVVDQGLDAAANPAGAGNGGGAAEFDENSPVPKKEQPQESKTFDYDYGLNGPKKKKESAEQCELDENVKDAKIEIVYKIKENPALVREAETMGKDQAAQKDVNHLIEQLSLGNENPGIGNRRVKGLKNVSEARGRNEGRVYFREKDGKIEILAKSNKDNQNKVIGILQKMGY